jgi:polysaccharide export outer membrane protein
VLSKKLLATVGCLIALVLSGCSEIVPGLNVHIGSAGRHEYSVVSDEKNGGQKVVPAQPRPAYRVVAITPDVVHGLATSESRGSGDDLPSLLPSDVPPDYRLGPGDAFFPIVWEHQDLTQPVQSAGSPADPTQASVQGRLVNADGTAFYPYVGWFKAEGMTAKEMSQFLTDRLKAVIVNPQVDVRIVSYRAHRIEVTGEVNKPGTITLDDTPKGVLQAIDLSGGLTPLASRRRAILVRDGRAIAIDLAGLLSGDRLVGNPGLQPGDVLHIPDQSGDQVFMLGAVTRPNPIFLTQDSTSLIQALTTSGGLNSLNANQSGVLVFRMHRADAKQLDATVYTLDMSRPEAMLLAGEFALEPRDVVYVQQTAFAQYNSVITELLPTATELFYLLEIKNTLQ